MFKKSEIVVVDGQRQFGNQYCLPSGPLREPMSRLNEVDFIVHNNNDSPVEFNMELSQGNAINVLNPEQQKSLAEFTSQPVHAIAGIGHPERFFEQLRNQGIELEPHPFSDHHPFQADDINFKDTLPILMTEKDAVKCQHFAKNDMWFIPVEATVSGNLDQLIIQKLTGSHPYG